MGAPGFGARGPLMGEVAVVLDPYLDTRYNGCRPYPVSSNPIVQTRDNTLTGPRT